MDQKRKSIFVGVISFVAVLCSMPLGHALMIMMEHFLNPEYLHTATFIMGAVGFAMTIYGVFVKGDTQQTLWGLFGGLLFWTGWVEFIYVYYAHRFGVMDLVVDGQVVTKGEYLIMPSSFGFWMMFMMLYLFNIRSGCNMFNWLQRHIFRDGKIRVEMKPMTRHTSLVTFMELNLMMWSCYLLLMFCYDEEFIGEHHPITAIVAFGCLIGAIYMFRKLIRISQWGYALRFSIATVIVFWTFVEILGRWNLFEEIWVNPMAYKTEMITILVIFIILMIYVFAKSGKKKSS